MSIKVLENGYDIEVHFETAQDGRTKSLAELVLEEVITKYLFIADEQVQTIDILDDLERIHKAFIFGEDNGEEKNKA